MLKLLLQIIDLSGQVPDLFQHTFDTGCERSVIDNIFDLSSELLDDFGLLTKAVLIFDPLREA